MERTELENKTVEELTQMKDELELKLVTAKENLDAAIYKKKEVEDNIKAAMVRVTCICPFCGEVHDVNLTEDEYVRYAVYYKELGTIHIQDVSSRLTEDERELLKTGICRRCWNKM